MSNPDIQSILNTGQLFEDKEEFEKAYVLYLEMIKRFPQDNDLITRIAHLAELLGKNDVAIEYWEKSLALNPADAGAYSKLSDLYYNVNKYKYYMTRAKLKTAEDKPVQAISDFKKALDVADTDKERLEASFLVAQLYEFTSKKNEAIDEYLKMLNIEDNVNVYYRLAVLYEKEDVSSAIDILKKGLKVFPDSPNLKEKYAQIMTKQNNPQEAIKFAQTPEAKAKAYLGAGELDNAWGQINKIPKKDNDYYSLLAEYYFIKEEYDNCLEAVSELEKINALNPVPYQMKALVFEKKDDKFLSAYNWGKCYALQGKTEMALGEYLNAYRLDNKSATVITDIINMYEIQNDKYPAVEFMEKLIKIEPKNTYILKKLATFYTKEGELSEAENYLEQIIEIDEHDFDTIYSLASLYEQNRKLKKALSLYKLYLEKAPLSALTNTVKSKVEKLEAADLQDEKEEEGLIDKIFKIFQKNK